MASKQKNNIPPARLIVYEKLAAQISGLEIKGAAMPYTSCNGHMFSFLDSDGRLGLRLPKNLKEEFIIKFNTTLCEAHGTVLKEYVLVPDNIFNSLEIISEYFKASFEYVSSLKPKPTKKTK